MAGITPTPGRSVERREEILVGAASLLRRRGYHGVGMDDIGAHVGITGPGVYRHFASKEDLLYEVISRFSELVAVEVASVSASRSSFDESQSPLDLPAVRGFIHVGLRNPDLLTVYLRDLRHLPRERIHELRTPQGALSREWERLLPSADLSDRRLRALRLTAASGVLLHVSQDSSLSIQAREKLLDCMLHPIFTHVFDAPTHISRSGDGLAPVSTREAVLAAAAASFRNTEFRAVSLRQIGERVGISASGVSRLFESKELLLAALLDRASEHTAAEVVKALRRSRTAEQATFEILSAYAALGSELNDVLSVSMTRVYALPETERAKRRRSRKVAIQELAHVIRLTRPTIPVAEARVRAGAAFSLINEVIMDDSSRRLFELKEQTAECAFLAALSERNVGVSSPSPFS
jgi:AcrR family transcriptional regulator